MLENETYIDFQLMFLTRENFGFLHKLPIEIANYGSLNECLESHQRGYERVHYSQKGIST